MMCFWWWRRLIVSESDLRPVRPFDRLRSPVILIIIDISPFGLSATTIFLNPRCHVNTILLFQLFIGQMLCRRRLNS